MSWNYRVVRFKDEAGVLLQIREVYYNENGTPRAHCNAAVVSESIAGITSELVLMRHAAKQPILDAAKDFGKKPR